MTFETKQAYAEVYEVLQNMPIEYVKKIPKKIIQLFEREKIDNYAIKINKSNPIDKNYLSKKAIAIIAALNYRYWCPNEKIKNDLYKMYLANNEKYEKELLDKYNIDNLFMKNKKEKKEINEEIKSNKALVKHKENSFIQKIYSKIQKFLKRK